MSNYITPALVAGSTTMNTTIPLNLYGAAAKKVVFDGNSITEGNRDTGVDTSVVDATFAWFAGASGVQQAISDANTSRGFSAPTFVNIGHSGDTIAAMLARVATTIAAVPTDLIVWIGINDVFAGTADGVSAANLNSYLQAIYDSVSTCRVRVCELLNLGPPNHNENPTGNSNSAAVVSKNVALKAVVANYGLARWVPWRAQWIAFENASNPTFVSGAATSLFQQNGTHPWKDGAGGAAGQTLLKTWFASLEAAYL